MNSWDDTVRIKERYENLVLDNRKVKIDFQRLNPRDKFRQRNRPLLHSEISFKQRERSEDKGKSKKKKEKSKSKKKHDSHPKKSKKKHKKERKESSSSDGEDSSISLKKSNSPDKS